MIPITGDKKIFIHWECKDSCIEDNKNSNVENNKHYMCFIDVPKRFQSIDDNLINLNETDDQSETIV
jgi:hypothetical protein